MCFKSRFFDVTYPLTLQKIPYWILQATFKQYQLKKRVSEAAAIVGMVGTNYQKLLLYL